MQLLLNGYSFWLVGQKKMEIDGGDDSQNMVNVINATELYN